MPTFCTKLFSISSFWFYLTAFGVCCRPPWKEPSCKLQQRLHRHSENMVFVQHIVFVYDTVLCKTCVRRFDQTMAVIQHMVFV